MLCIEDATSASTYKVLSREIYHIMEAMMETEARLRVTDKRPHSPINHPHALVGGHNGPHVICLSKTLSFYRPRAWPLLGEIVVQRLRKDQCGSQVKFALILARA